jgi:phenylacetate-coenzyme A ligase PaaK-like adenylate-forming protein
MNTSTLLSKVLEHYDPYEKILEYQTRNFIEHIERHDTQCNWWFNDVKVAKLADLHELAIRSGSHIIDQQLQNPPYGIWSKGPIVFQSSASSNEYRKVFPRSLFDYNQFLIGVARSLENHSVNTTDAIISTDTGGMFSGHVGIEDAAVQVFGATRVRCSSPMLTEKIKTMEQFEVTVISGSPTKLERMAKLNPAKLLSKPIKMVISTGAPAINNNFVAEAFGVDRVTDMYGLAEMGNVAWTCKHGHFHVNIDLCYIEQGQYFSNISNLPIFRYESGEKLEFSYKGTCACGSNLPTIDKFIASNIDRSKKN